MSKLSILSGIFGGLVGVYVVMYTDYTSFEKIILMFMCFVILGLVCISLMIEQIKLILEIHRAEQKQIRRHLGSGRS